MWTCIAHAGYFVVCAVLLTFLRCPAFSRAALLLSVPLNAAAEVNQQPALDLGSLSLLLLALSLGTNPKRMQSQHFWLVFQFVHVTFAGHWFVNQLWAVAQKQKASSLWSYPPSSTPQKDELDGFMEQDNLSHQDSFGSVSPPHRQWKPESMFMKSVSCNSSTPRPASQVLFDDIPLRNLGGIYIVYILYKYKYICERLA
ncbi:protein brambleberry-like isoform X2 [Takifugu rubripes]|uniref:protein brambleberry-like isoform X2 n=1 Tax=Takifugu rubripes TaxID=31033 RepID=UPI001145F4F4|nr:protein brambleberry-like isoform X2 [Takifugu rubripes]